MQKKGRERKIEMLKRYNNESYVAIYDQRYRSDQFRKINDLFSYINLKSENFVFSGNILDFGTGTGLYWDFLNQCLDELEIFEKNEIRFLALDLALAMLDEFQKKKDNEQRREYISPPHSPNLRRWGKFTLSR